MEHTNSFLLAPRFHYLNIPNLELLGRHYPFKAMTMELSPYAQLAIRDFLRKVIIGFIGLKSICDINIKELMALLGKSTNLFYKFRWLSSMIDIQLHKYCQLNLGV